ALILSITAGSAALKHCVAPSSRALSSLASSMSTAITSTAPTALAASSDEKPTPPSPTTATLVPASTFAVLITAPAPVMTAQPNSAASSQGSVGSIFTADRRETTVYSAKAAQPR